jgi:hypothetical protein
MELYLKIFVAWLDCFIGYPLLWVSLLVTPWLYEKAEAFWWLVPPMIVAGMFMFPFGACMYWGFQCAVALDAVTHIGLLGILLTAAAIIYGASIGLTWFRELGRVLDASMGIDAYARIDNYLTAMCVMGLATAAYSATKAVLGGSKSK